MSAHSCEGGEDGHVGRLARFATVSRSRMSSHRMWLTPLASCTLSRHSCRPQEVPKHSRKLLACPQCPEEVRTCQPLEQRAC